MLPLGRLIGIYILLASACDTSGSSPFITSRRGIMGILLSLLCTIPLSATSAGFLYSYVYWAATERYLMCHVPPCTLILAVTVATVPVQYVQHEVKTCGFPALCCSGAVQSLVASDDPIAGKLNVVSARTSEGNSFSQSWRRP